MDNLPRVDRFECGIFYQSNCFGIVNFTGRRSNEVGDHPHLIVICTFVAHPFAPPD
jgi:hypothetical protein